MDSILNIFNYDELKLKFNRLAEETRSNLERDDIKEYIFSTKYITSSNGSELRLSQSNSYDFIKLYESEGQFTSTIKGILIAYVTSKFKFCPFCGKIPMISYVYHGKKERTFDLDHFFPKDTYKHLAFNIYNLIPACKSCNFLKSDANPISILTHPGDKIFHPYFGFIVKGPGNNDYLIEKNDFSTKYCFKQGLGTFYINKDDKHFKYFRLPQIYFNAQDSINDTLFIMNKDSKMKVLENELNMKRDNLKDLIFQDFYPSTNNDILKFSNGKLKKDIIENL